MNNCSNLNNISAYYDKLALNRFKAQASFLNKQLIEIRDLALSITKERDKDGHTSDWILGDYPQGRTVEELFEIIAKDNKEIKKEKNPLSWP